MLKKAMIENQFLPASNIYLLGADTPKLLSLGFADYNTKFINNILKEVMKQAQITI
jgi:hypothetical protein